MKLKVKDLIEILKNEDENAIVKIETVPHYSTNLSFELEEE
tara:strand:- start:4702 stop:4824 length:123 start_codon:yes stop_codon:yes gene_type:complete